jgi:hypothetical protein
MKTTKIAIFAFLLLAFAASAYAQKDAKNSGLFWIREDGKYGYIDRTGKTVIAPQYENTMGFNEGLAATKMNGKYGFIDTKGNWAIKPQYDFAYIFMDGLAAVKIGKQTAWIDKTGRQIIQPQDFEETAMGFSEGRLAVKRGGKWGYIDKTGRMIVEPKFKKATKFEGGAAQVETEDGMHHWIAADGRILWSQKPNEKKAEMKNAKH